MCVCVHALCVSMCCVCACVVCACVWAFNVGVGCVGLSTTVICCAVNKLLMHYCIIIVDTWKETVEGEPSYSGTTVACALFKFDRVHIANVGDSKIVLATRNPNYGYFNEPEILARELSKTHRPDDVEEKQRIENLGGIVYVKDSGVARIFWQGTTLTSKALPRPNLSRSLGDLWSCTENKEYIISPVPHTGTHFVTDDDLFYVIASDGVWDVMEPQEVVEIIYGICRGPTTRSDMVNKKRLISVALQAVVNHAYRAWHRKRCQADNISCIIIYYYKQVPK